MGHELTEAEWQRIYDFANAAAYERQPDLLVPEGGNTEE